MPVFVGVRTGVREVRRGRVAGVVRPDGGGADIAHGKLEAVERLAGEVRGSTRITPGAVTTTIQRPLWAAS
jgi:hypothetical protein